MPAGRRGDRLKIPRFAQPWPPWPVRPGRDGGTVRAARGVRPYTGRVRPSRVLRLRRPPPRLAALLALLALLGAVGGAARGATPPAPAAASALTTGVQETVLPNGLTVLVKEVRSAPVVSFSVWYRVGSRNEHTGITGVSHLLEHMLFKGTRQYRLGEIARTLFLNGAAFNASTYYDWTNYYATIAADRLDLAMRIEADRMVNSRIDKADLDAEMTVVRSELEGGENSPGRLLWQAVVSAAFQAHPYHWPVIGWRSDVENVSRDAIYQYYRTHYGPGNAVAVVVGDVTTADALRLVRQHFGPIKAIPKPPEVHTVEPPQRGERRVTVRRSGSLPMALIAWKAPAAVHPDTYALDVLAGVLGEGRTSRLYQALVEKGVAARVDAGSPSLRDPFLFYVSATARPGVTAERLETALLEEVERVTATPITDEELTRAQRRAEADFVFQTNSVTAQARQLGYWAMIGDWRYLTTYLDRIRALTAADVQSVARRTFSVDTRTVGHFVPSDGGGPAPPPPREASARVERPKRGDRPIPLPRTPAARAPNRQVTRFALDNGISVIVQENHATPTVALRASVPGGSLAQSPGRPGVAGFTAAMLTRGTEQAERARLRHGARGRGRGPRSQRRHAGDDDHRPRAHPGPRSGAGSLHRDAPAARVSGRRLRSAQERGAGGDRPGEDESGPRRRACLRPGRLSAGPHAPPGDVRGVGEDDRRDDAGRPRRLPPPPVRPRPDDRRRGGGRDARAGPGGAPEAARRLAAQPRDPAHRPARPAAPGGARGGSTSPSRTRARRRSSGATRADSAGATLTSTPRRS